MFLTLSRSVALAVLFLLISAFAGLASSARAQQAPVIVTQPSDATIIAKGSSSTSASFSVIATGSNLQYRWFRRLPPPLGSGEWVNLYPDTAGLTHGPADQPTLSVNVANITQNGAQYRCQVSNSFGTVTSNAATLTVVLAQEPPAITVQPMNASANAGQSVTLSVQVTGTTPLTIQWYKGTTPIPGANSTNYQIPNASVSHTGSYYVQISNHLGSVRSNTISVTVLGATGTGDTHVFNTFAGANALPGATNGSGTAARFNYPNGLALDSAGNLYVADESNNMIRRITPQGQVTTFAGQGPGGYSDGPAATARFLNPKGVAVDSAGNVYVTDTFNHTVRKISADGTVSTLAGLAGAPGSVDGTGSAARFNSPLGIAVDAARNVFVADRQNHTIRKITPAGVVTTLAGLAGSAGAGNGTGPGARFNNPNGLAIDSSGTLYVADSYNHVIRKITPSGAVTTLAGSAGLSGITNGVNGRFTYPNGVAVDVAGNVYVAEAATSVIRRVTPSGVISTIAGSPNFRGITDGLGSVARFVMPIAIAVTPNGTLYVADNTNYTIRIGLISTAPQTPPAPRTEPVAVGANATFTAGVLGSVPMTYQWQRLAAGASTWTNISNGAGYSGATTTTLTVNNVTAAMNGDQYRMIATNSLGSATSPGTTLVLASIPPVITSQPASLTNVMPGSNVSFTVTATGTAPLSYRWFLSLPGTGSFVDLTKDLSGRYSGAATPMLIIPNVTADMDGHQFRCEVSNGAGETTSLGATLSLLIPQAKLTNLSVRTLAGPGGDALTLGFTTGGAGQKQLLLRVAGPALEALGVPDTMADPRMLVHTTSNGSLVAANDNWGGGNELVTLMSRLGAFPWSAGSRDAAASVNLGVGGYTVQATGDTSGEVIVEVYDADALTAPSRLSNLSALSSIGISGRAELIVGFTISGDGGKKVLLRGIGPTLGTLVDQPVVENPRLVIRRGTEQIAENDDWNNDAALLTAFAQVGAFPLLESSKDAAILLTLAPGGYTMTISAEADTSGLVIAEIYEVP